MFILAPPLLVDSKIGTLTVARKSTATTSSKVSLSIRPEDLRLSEAKPTASKDTVIVGSVEAKVFLGECIDFRIDVNGIILLARSHPSVRTPVGGSIYMSIDPAKCTIVGHADSA